MVSPEFLKDDVSRFDELMQKFSVHRAPKNTAVKIGQQESTDKSMKHRSVDLKSNKKSGFNRSPTQITPMNKNSHVQFEA